MSHNKYLATPDLERAAPALAGSLEMTNSFLRAVLEGKIPREAYNEILQNCLETERVLSEFPKDDGVETY